MKIVGRNTKHKKGFTEDLNRFFQLIAAFRKDKLFITRGVYRFKTLEEADKWHHRLLRGKSPGRRQ